MGRFGTETVLRAAALLGCVAAALGAMTLAGYAEAVGTGELTSTGAVATQVARSALVLVEVVLCLAWSSFAGVASTSSRARPLAAVAALGKISTTVGCIAWAWPWGWSFILDPSGAHASIFLCLGVSALQDMTLCAAALRGSVAKEAQAITGAP